MEIMQYLFLTCFALMLVINEVNCQMIIKGHVLYGRDMRISNHITGNTHFEFRSVCIIERRDRTTQSGSIHVWFERYATKKKRRRMVFEAARVIDNIRSIQAANITGPTLRIIREIKGHETDTLANTLPRSVSQNRKMLPKLYKVKGGENVVVAEFSVEFDDLSQNDAFVLQCAVGIFVFFGTNASEKEKDIANKLSRYIQNVDSRDWVLQNADIITINGNDTQSANWRLFRSQFWSMDTEVKEDDDERDEDFSEGRYEEVSLKAVNGGTTTLYENRISFRETIQGNEQNSYCLRYNSAALVGFVYIGNFASFETNRKVLMMAEALKWDEVVYDDREILRVSYVQEMHLTAQFLINFYDYEDYLVY